ncbi:MAG: hypothetical protein RLZZ536_2523 [Planctomycetota bacterium]|jgi:hypothetical protein
MRKPGECGQFARAGWRGQDFVVVKPGKREEAAEFEFCLDCAGWACWWAEFSARQNFLGCPPVPGLWTAARNRRNACIHPFDRRAWNSRIHACKSFLFFCQNQCFRLLTRRSNEKIGALRGRSRLFCTGTCFIVKAQERRRYPTEVLCAWQVHDVHDGEGREANW